MRAQPFLIPIVLGVAFIAVVALLNRPEDPHALKHITLTVRDGVFMKVAPAANLITGVPAHDVVTLVRPPSIMTCVWMSASGENKWLLYPNINAYKKLARWQKREGQTLTDAHPLDPDLMADQYMDYFRVYAPHVDFYVQAIGQGSDVGCRPPS